MKLSKDWAIRSTFLLAVAGLLGVPFALRPPKVRLENPERLVILSPHDEAVKIEFEQAFSEWHEKHFGRPVHIDWLNVGGGQGSIDLYVESQFNAAWRRAWGARPPEKIDWLAVDRPALAGEDPNVARARELLAGEGIGIDILFGSGDHIHKKYKGRGWLARIAPPAEYLADLPPTTRPDGKISPFQLGGVGLYDADHYWFGAVLTRLGILTNKVVCDKIGVPGHIRRRIDAGRLQWDDLADPAFRSQLALADPNVSGSAKLCYETVLQRYGWDRGWPVLTWIAANARYFGAGSTQAALDISRCEAAAGMIIDYYGRTQVQYVGPDRLAYCSPPGATATSPDPIAMFRGSPNQPVAERFIRFVLTGPGQKLWMGKPDPDNRFGGPRRFGLYRPPISRRLYSSFSQHMIFAENPYADPTGFNIDAATLSRRFRFLGFLMKAAFIENGELLRQAADAARAAGPASPAMIAFESLPFTERQMWDWADRFNNSDALESERLTQQLCRLFREKYRAVISDKSTTQAQRHRGTEKNFKK